MLIRPGSPTLEQFGRTPFLDVGAYAYVQYPYALAGVTQSSNNTNLGTYYYDAQNRRIWIWADGLDVAMINVTPSSSDQYFLHTRSPGRASGSGVSVDVWVTQ